MSEATKVYRPLPVLSTEGLGAASEARCWWPSGHFWSEIRQGRMQECLWYSARRFPPSLGTP